MKDYRSTLHRKTNRLRGLRSSLGFFDSNSRIMTFTGYGNEKEIDEKDWKYRGSSIVGAIVHERCHWLQHIGTTWGFTSMLIADAQNEHTHRFLHSLGSRLSQENIPLLDCQDDRTTEWRCIWEGLEYLHWLLHGGFTRQELENRPQYRLSSILEMYVQMLRSIIQYLNGQASLPSEIEKYWQNDVAFSNESIAFVTVSDDEVVGGAYHLMETAARINEYIRVQQLISRFNPDYMIETDLYFSGDYRHAWHTFTDLTSSTFTTKSVLAFLALVDYALNPPFPPFVPPLILEIPFNHFLPWIRFIEAAKVLRDKRIDLSESLYLADVDAVRSFQQEIESHLNDGGLIDSPASTLSSLRLCFPSISSGARPHHWRNLETGDLPVLSIDSAMLTIALTLGALEARQSCPELIPCPGLVYTRDRHEFHRLFDSISPPFQLVLGKGASITSEEYRQDISVYIQMAIWNTTLRALVYDEYDAICETLREFTAVFTVDFVVACIRALLAETKLTDEIVSSISEER